MKRRRVIGIAAAAAATSAVGTWVRAQQPSPHAIDIPSWFLESFLDFKDEAATAAKGGKRLMLYFGQDGCPYCRELMTNNFSQKAIVDKTRKHFEAVAINIWGDREVTWTDGQRMSEKQFAKLLKVQFTPTLLFLDEQAQVTSRLNGYWPPHRFDPALDYVIARLDRKGISLADHVAQHAHEAANAQLAEEPFYLKPPFDLRRKAGGKPLAVLWETRSCKACDEMHSEGFRRAEIKALLAKFDVVRFALGDATELIAPDGRKRSANEWARELKLSYTPSVVFFDAGNREVFRFEGYVRPFHLAGGFDYVAQGAYRTQPEFQRFLQEKTERAKARGQSVDLWK